MNQGYRSRKSSGKPTGKPSAKPPPKTDARRVAIDALVRIDSESAYANLVLPQILERSGLDERDRAFVTELVYGTTRMKRACDWIVNRFVMREPDALVRAALRIGAYQIAFIETPPHAAVSATVDAVPKKVSGFVNAVLRKVATAPLDWPDEPTRLSYPDWVIEQLTSDLGPSDAVGALEAMNVAPTVSRRSDGYIQDPASQWVAEAVDARPDMRVLDLCAAPGGKATWMAASGATVIAGDSRPSRVGLIANNAKALGSRGLHPVASDGLHPPFRSDCADRVLVDAPCSGLGTLRRRPDARWRVSIEDVGRLATLQRDLVAAAAALVRPGGRLIYSVCTLSREETLGIDEFLAVEYPSFTPLDPPGSPWRRVGRGALLLPQAAGTDGMYILILEAT